MKMLSHTPKFKIKSRASHFLLVCENTRARDPMENHYLVSSQHKKKNLISSTPEPVIWSCDTDQQITCFDSCQLTIKWVCDMNVNQD